MTPYTLTRSNRKTLAIHITKNAEVIVRAPLKLSKSDIDQFVESKAKWIEKHLTIQAGRVAEKTGFSLNYGDTILMMGKPYIITAVEGNLVKLHQNKIEMPLGLEGEQIKDACVKLYKLIAKNELPRRVLEYAKVMNVVPQKVKINSATTRWGSCSGQNSLNFSWRLLMASEEVINYVVVHELAHIKEHNHSPKFWAVVESVLPDYKVRQKKLKELQIKLSKENWD